MGRGVSRRDAQGARATERALKELAISFNERHQRYRNVEKAGCKRVSRSKAGSGGVSSSPILRRAARRSGRIEVAGEPAILGSSKSFNLVKAIEANIRTCILAARRNWCRESYDMVDLVLRGRGCVADAHSSSKSIELSSRHECAFFPRQGQAPARSDDLISTGLKSASVFQWLALPIANSGQLATIIIARDPSGRLQSIAYHGSAETPLAGLLTQQSGGIAAPLPLAVAWPTDTASDPKAAIQTRAYHPNRHFRFPPTTPFRLNQRRRLLWVRLGGRGRQICEAAHPAVAERILHLREMEQWATKSGRPGLLLKRHFVFLKPPRPAEAVPNS